MTEQTTSQTISVRDQIAALIQDDKTHDEILSTLNISNGDLRFHCNHIASEIGSRKASVDGLARQFRRLSRRKTHA